MNVRVCGGAPWCNCVQYQAVPARMLLGTRGLRRGPAGPPSTVRRQAPLDP